MSGSQCKIERVESVEDDPMLRALLREFHEWMRDAAPMSSDSAAELATDERRQARVDESWAWVARDGDEGAGCVLLYGLTDELAEFKRLWVRPDDRRRGVGRRLTLTVVETACRRGYDRLGLTTPPWSDAAQSLYESLGFERTPPYPETRLPEEYHDEAIFMQLSLRGSGDAPG